MAIYKKNCIGLFGFRKKWLQNQYLANLKKIEILNKFLSFLIKMVKKNIEKPYES
jgi:hypothetical protein